MEKNARQKQGSLSRTPDNEEPSTIQNQINKRTLTGNNRSNRVPSSQDNQITDLFFFIIKQSKKNKSRTYKSSSVAPWRGTLKSLAENFNRVSEIFQTTIIFRKLWPCNKFSQRISACTRFRLIINAQIFGILTGSFGRPLDRTRNGSLSNLTTGYFVVYWVENP